MLIHSFFCVDILSGLLWHGKLLLNFLLETGVLWGVGKAVLPNTLSAVGNTFRIFLFLANDRLDR